MTTATHATHGTPTLPARFSIAWGFLVLNIYFKDIHDVFRAGFIEEVQAGTFNGNPITEGVILAGGIGTTVLVAMVFLPLFLTVRANRWLNGIMAPLAVAMIASTPRNDMDDTWFTLVLLATLSWILVAAVRGKG